MANLYRLAQSRKTFGSASSFCRLLRVGTNTDLENHRCTIDALNLLVPRLSKYMKLSYRILNDSEYLGCFRCSASRIL